MVFIMSTLINMEFVHALNPLYAFPIVAVILCAFIVYAFGFKSPVQPPSFDAIDEERKTTKKRKTKDTNKVKVVQNGKLNGSNVNKNQVSVSSKKKESEKSVSADKISADKPVNEKKSNKKSKSSNEKKVSQEKKKDSFSQEDAGEGGWVQLISKKGRKNRKKDEATNVERQTCIVKPVQNLQMTKPDEIILPEEPLKADVKADPKADLKADIIENSVPEKKPALKEIIKEEINEVVPKEERKGGSNKENIKEKIIIIEDCKPVDVIIEKTAPEEKVTKNEKINEETTTKSKKKKKKASEANTNNSNVTNSVPPAEQVISEIPAPQPVNSTVNSSAITETSDTTSDKVEEPQSKETKTSTDNKSSNVVFDELAGLYPEPKEQRKKKRVRRDH